MGTEPSTPVAEEARRFHMHHCLGSGGFGEVYLASMRSLGGVETDVAVKVLHQGLDPRSQAVQRLRDEALILGSLNHPSVLTVHDLVLLGKRVALVMEYVPGLDLEECLVLRPAIPPRPAATALSRVADAIAAALVSPGPTGEPLALVHRDIKPSNIRIGRHGNVKLLDFGIAKAADARREAKTQANLMMGSPWYMAPERYNRIHDEPASDVYALGCVLYEIVAGGVRLFDSLSPRDHFRLAMDDHAHDAFVGSAVASMPDPARRLLLEVLAFESAQRPTAADLVPRLEALAEQSAGPSLERWCRDFAWPDVDGEDGSWVGKVLTEERLSALKTPETLPVLDARQGLATFDLEGAEDSEAMKAVKALAAEVSSPKSPAPVDAKLPSKSGRRKSESRPQSGLVTPVVLGLAAVGAIAAVTFGLYVVAMFVLGVMVELAY